MLKRALFLLVAIVAVLYVVIATRPAAFKVERSAVFAAPPSAAFALVSDFHQWAGWSPWEKRDPNMKKSYEGPTAGVGGSYYWNGNNQVGEGRMTLTEVRQNERVGIKLEFMKPFPSTNVSTFTFTPQGDGTQVTWAMEGKHTFMSKAFSLFGSMDKMIGGDFENGLSNMKGLAETNARQHAAATPTP